MKEVRMMIGGGTDTDGLTAMAAHVRAGDVFLGAGSDESQIGTQLICIVFLQIVDELTISPPHKKSEKPGSPRAFCFLNFAWKLKRKNDTIGQGKEKETGRHDRIDCSIYEKPRYWQ